MIAKRYKYILGVLAVLILFYIFCTTVVLQGRTSVVLSFGKPVRVLSEPGLYLRFPYPVNSIMDLDSRLTLLEPRPSEFLTADKKNLILENAICYRITEPVKFMNTVRDQKGAEIRMTDLLSSHTGLLLGVKELSDIVNVDTSRIQFTQMNDELTRLMRQDSKGMGIEIEKVFIKRIMLPHQNVLAVYNRMRAERDRIAQKYLAEGEEKALEIRAEADKSSRTLIAEAEREAAVIRGEAEAEAMRIYGDAYRKNPQFFKFVRSLEAYEKMFNEQTVIVLDENSPILKALFSGGRVEQ
ncbi:MAG: protease modulator HflC [candidate division Zixibacteria bacterium]|nr:protease modulator HflC [candidate division Zixibacteria bacterium]